MLGERDAIDQMRRRRFGPQTLLVMRPQQLHLSTDCLGVGDRCRVGVTADDAVRELV
jgi:hypothetical protein